MRGWPYKVDTIVRYAPAPGADKADRRGNVLMNTDDFSRTAAIDQMVRLAGANFPRLPPYDGMILILIAAVTPGNKFDPSPAANWPNRPSPDGGAGVPGPR